MQNANSTLLARQLFEYADAQTITKELWSLFTVYVATPEFDSLQPRQRGNTGCTLLVLTQFILTLEKSVKAA